MKHLVEWYASIVKPIITAREPESGLRNPCHGGVYLYNTTIVTCKYKGVAKMIPADEFAQSVQRLVYKLGKNYQLCDRACLSRYGVTGSQGYSLLAVPQDGAASMNELSEKMGLASSTMTRMIDQLCNKGLVERGPDHEDRRVVRVWLTEKGHAVQQNLRQILKDFFRHALKGFAAEERAGVLETLQRVAEATDAGLATFLTD